MQCNICKKPATKAELVVDHILPLSRGGSREAENLRLVHMQCHHKPLSRWSLFKKQISKFVWRFISHSHGTDNMQYMGTTRMGMYQIYECKKCGFTEGI